MFYLSPSNTHKIHSMSTVQLPLFTLFLSLSSCVRLLLVLLSIQTPLKCVAPKISISRSVLKVCSTHRVLNTPKNIAVNLFILSFHNFLIRQCCTDCIRLRVFRFFAWHFLIHCATSKHTLKILKRYMSFRFIRSMSSFAFLQILLTQRMCLQLK